MQWIIRAIIGLVAALALFIGLQIMLAPNAIMAAFNLIATSETGISAVRGDIGGFFVATGLFALVGVMPKQRRWLLAAATMPGLALVARIIGLTTGPTTPEIIQSMLIELVVVGIMIAGFVVIGKRPAKAAIAADADAATTNPSNSDVTDAARAENSPK